MTELKPNEPMPIEKAIARIEGVVKHSVKAGYAGYYDEVAIEKIKNEIANLNLRCEEQKKEIVRLQAECDTIYRKWPRMENPRYLISQMVSTDVKEQWYAGDKGPIPSYAEAERECCEGDTLVRKSVHTHQRMYRITNQLFPTAREAIEDYCEIKKENHGG